MSSKKELHRIYKTESGMIVPSVTQIIQGNLGWNKNVLINWAASKARNGKDHAAIRDQAGHAGTLAHAMIETHLRWELGDEADPVDTSEYSQESIDQAQRAYGAFLDWADNTNFTPMMIEKPLVSEQYRFGGTIDLVAKIGDVNTLIDFKTSSGVYREHRLQLAAYHYLMKERVEVDLNPMILHLSKHQGRYTVHSFPGGLENEWQAFLHCLKLDYLQSIIE